MKKTIAALLALVMALSLLTACGSKNDNSADTNTDGSNTETTLSGTVSTDGSTSMEKVINSLGESFMAMNKDVKFTYNPTGSGSGIQAVSEGRCDIGLSSRALKDDEKASGLKETTLALDEMVCADMRAYAPDCIVADSMAVWGKAVAKKLNILHVDTGAIYRTIGYAAFSRGLDAKDESQIAPLLKEIQIDMAFDENSGQKMLLDGKDVSTEIRLPEISMYASNVSALPCVRAYLLEMQRDIARKRSVIMDGRDIGTVVLPDADLKIYLTASAEERARRRCLELSERGTPKAYEEVLREINERDYQDMHRDIAPLREAEDAVRLDTSKLSFEESEQALLSLIQEKLK